MWNATKYEQYVGTKLSGINCSIFYKDYTALCFLGTLYTGSTKGLSSILPFLEFRVLSQINTYYSLKYSWTVMWNYLV